MFHSPLATHIRYRRAKRWNEADGDRCPATVEADGVTLGVEHFGDAAAPLVLLAGGTTMLSWPDALCEALARGGRHVVRYDLRDSGASTTVDPEARRTRCAISQPTPRRSPANSTTGPAHLAGIGVGGMVAQVAALDHPERVLGAHPRRNAARRSRPGRRRPA